MNISKLILTLSSGQLKKKKKKEKKKKKKSGNQAATSSISKQTENPAKSVAIKVLQGHCWLVAASI